MKRILILIIALSLFAVLTKANAMLNEYDELAKSDKAGAILYAKKTNELYTDFKINFHDSILLKPYWFNITNPAWATEIIYEDINQDEKKELVIVLTKGTGTGILQREAHVFQIQQQKFEKTQIPVPVEVPVEDPIAIVLKSVKTELTPYKTNIAISDKTYTIDIRPYEILSAHLFGDIYFGNLVDFEVKDNQLVAKVGGQISPAGGYIGDIQITYTLKDIMYQMKSVEFKAIE